MSKFSQNLTITRCTILQPTPTKLPSQLNDSRVTIIVANLRTATPYLGFSQQHYVEAMLCQETFELSLLPRDSVSVPECDRELLEHWWSSIRVYYHRDQVEYDILHDQNETESHATQHILESNNEAVVHYIIKPETPSIVPASGVCGEIELKEELCFDESSIIVEQDEPLIKTQGNDAKR
uniref:Uncharacterized protein n=1 Tax=Timema shepardi TaxID=629360 RepID=A0A7R9B4Q6_TIMSH|nr:unnamed protein product [Timema shepardi]